MSDDKRQHFHGLFGLQLGQSRVKPEGAPPSDEELALLVEGEADLDAARRREIITHLLNDPQRYRQWLTLAELREKLPEPAPPASLGELFRDALNRWLVDWRYALGGLGSVAAVLVFIALYGQPPSDSFAPTPTSDQQLSMAAPDRAKEPGPQQGAEAFREQFEAERQAADTARAETEEEAAARAKAEAPAPSAAENCAPLLHPEFNDVMGQLCVPRADSEPPYVWRWQALDIDNKALNRLLTPPAGAGWGSGLRSSESDRWLAFRQRSDGETTVWVLAVAPLFDGEDSLVRRFRGDGYDIDYYWDGSELVLLSQRDFASEQQDFDPAAPVLTQTFNPETGQLYQPETADDDW